MTAQRLLVVLTVINLGLLAFLLTQTRVHIGAQGIRAWTNIDGSVLRGHALEIIDDQAGCGPQSISIPPIKTARIPKRRSFG